jgi:hypothetical protein
VEPPIVEDYARYKDHTVRRSIQISGRALYQRCPARHQSHDAAQIRRDLAVYRWPISSVPRPAVASLWRGPVSILSRLELGRDIGLGESGFRPYQLFADTPIRRHATTFPQESDRVSKSPREEFLVECRLWL